jgi:hypothetical protein
VPVHRPLCDTSGTGVSHHTMRHTGITPMLEAGVNPRVIQRLAGWTSLRMLERYGHVRDAEAQRAVTTMQAVIQKAVEHQADSEERSAPDASVESSEIRARSWPKRTVENRRNFLESKRGVPHPPGLEPDSRHAPSC